MPATQPAPILIIDDDPADAELTQFALRRGGIDRELIWLEGGAAALAHFSRDGASLPALVLLDLSMPGVDGREVLTRLKASATTRLVPVIMLSNSREPSEVNACYELGANGYLQKPSDLSAFVELGQALREYWLEASVLPNAQA